MDAFGVMVAILAGEAAPPLPDLPGRRCHGLHDPRHGRDLWREQWEALQGAQDASEDEGASPD